MLEPPDTAQRFVSDEERADAIVRLVGIDRRLRDWLQLRVEKPEQLPEDVRARLLRHPVGSGESPESRLARWVTVFGDDIDTIHDTRSRVVHGLRASDGEINGAIWLGLRLLALLEESGSEAESLDS